MSPRTQMAHRVVQVDRGDAGALHERGGLLVEVAHDPVLVGIAQHWGRERKQQLGAQPLQAHSQLCQLQVLEGLKRVACGVRDHTHTTAIATETHLG